MNGVRRIRAVGLEHGRRAAENRPQVEPALRILVDLPLALSRACAFNPWESLASR